MGNFISNKIICDECKKTHIKPDFFEIKCIARRNSNNMNLQYEELDTIVKINKYGKTLSNEPIKNMVDIDIIGCTCSNNHKIKCYSNIVIH